MQIFLLGFSVVFFVLVVLFVLIRVLKFVSDRFENTNTEDIKPPAAAPQPALIPAAAGDAYLHTVDDATAAVLMAIAAEESQIPLENLRIISLEQKDQKKGGKPQPPAQNKKYPYKSKQKQGDDMKYDITLNEKTYTVEVEKGEAVLLNTAAAAAIPAAAPVPAAPAPASAAAPVSVSGGTAVTSPLPGTVLSIKVSVGDAVKAGQILAIVEAMKMENEIPAPVGGTVKSITATTGKSVDTGAVLMVIG